MSNEGDNLHVVDTSNLLTLDELKELKRLASLSKSARFFFAIIIGVISLIGFDKLLSFLLEHQKWP